MFQHINLFRNSFKSFYITPVLRFFAKKVQPSITFTENEKIKLEQVYLDNEIAKFMNWKRYPINEEVFFEGEAEIISWENYRIEFGSLEKAQELADLEQLDLVLVRKNPPVVRLMNYRNWILRWAFKDRDLNLTKKYNENFSYMRLKHSILPYDFEYKLDRVFEFLKNGSNVVIEGVIDDKDDEEELKKLKDFEVDLIKKVKSRIINNEYHVENRSTEKRMSVLIKILNKDKDSAKGVNSSGQLPLMNEKVGRRKQNEKVVFDPVVVEDEDEFMKKILQGEKPDVEESRELKIDIEFTEPVIETEATHIKQKIITLLGDDLSQKFLKGKYKNKFI